jgi:hypothetical protein
VISGALYPPFHPLDPPDVLSVMQALEEAGFCYKLVSKLQGDVRGYRALVYDPTWRASSGAFPVVWDATPNRALAKAWMMTLRVMRRAQLAERRAQVAALETGQQDPITPVDHAATARRRLLKLADTATRRRADAAAEALVELPVVVAELLEYLCHEPVGAYLVVGEADVSALEIFKRSRAS